MNGSLWPEARRASDDRRLVLASGNPGKLAELSALLQPLGCTVLAQTALGVTEADEPYRTFVENALAKARHASGETGLPALADDSGLCVHALRGAPGVQSARYAQPPAATRAAQDAANNARLLQALHGAADRSAHFACVIVAVSHADDPEPLIASGRLDGHIALTVRGEGGFGYDPLFVLPDGRHLAELDAAEKNRISHRARAMQSLLPLLAQAWGWAVR